MARVPERKFDPTQPLVVRRFFVAAGRHFSPGDAFDWRRMSLAQRRVMQLFDNGKLMHADATPAPVSDLAGLQAREMVGRPAPEPVFNAEKTVEHEMQDEDILRAAAEVEPAPAAPAAGDELDALDMKALRAIAEEENAPFRVSRELQREAIREKRRNT